MLTYYVTFGSLLAAVVLGSRQWRMHETLYWPVLAALFVFSAYRYSVGCDWVGYLLNYTSAERFLVGGFHWRSFIGLNDAGHWGVIALLRANQLPYEYINVIYSALFFVGLHVFARRQINPLAVLVMAFPILILNMPMSAIRQGVGIGMMCLAYLAFCDRQMIRFVIYILIGSQFHSSIVVFLFLVPFIFGEINLRNVLFALVLGAPGILILLGSDAAAVANSRYIETDIDAAGAVFRVGFQVLTALYFLFFVAPAWKEYSPQDYRIVLAGAWMMLLCGGLLMLSTVIADRYGYYLIPLQILIFIKAPFLVPRSRQLIRLLPYLGLTAIFIVWTQFSSLFARCYTPYENWLFL